MITEKKRKTLTPVLFDKTLSDFVAIKNKKSLKELRGKIDFIDGYDYKSMRC
jgi:hypothetical protein